MAKILFYTATSAQFKALTTKDSNALYFLTDTHQLYKGDAPYSAPIEVVASFPATGVTGPLYVNSATYEAKRWNGSAWETVFLPVTTTVGASASDAELPTAKAVKTYVEGEVSTINTAINGVVSEVTYADKSLSVKNGTSPAVVTQLKGLVDGATYDGATGVLTLTTNGGTPVTVNLPVENFLAAASFNAATNVLTLTLTDNTTVTVNLSELVDTYTVDDTSSLDLTMDEHGKITGAVKVSAESDNHLSVKGDGLYVRPTDLSGKMSKVSGTAGTIVTADASGETVRTDKKVVTTLTNLDTDVPTAKAVTAVTSAIDSKADGAQNTADGKMAKKSGTADTVILGDANGEAVRSSAKIGGATLAASPDADTLATEAAVSAALTWKTL